MLTKQEMELAVHRCGISDLGRHSHVGNAG